MPLPHINLQEEAKRLAGLPTKGSRFLREFREFAMKGNIVDLAVGIMIGTAFNKIVTSLVNDMVMPPIGYLMGKVNFSSYFLNLSGTEYESIEAAKAAGAATINYGLFFNVLIEFTIIAFVTFLIVRQINRMRRRGEVPPTTKECPYCFEIISIKAVRCPKCTSQL